MIIVLYHIIYRLRVPSGKDTAGNGDKPRDAYLPARVERDLYRYQTREDIAPDDPVIMAVDGWDSFQAIEPYLNAPSPEVVNDAFDDAGLA